MKFHTFGMAIVCLFESVVITLASHLLDIARIYYSLTQHLSSFNADISLVFYSIL